MPRKIATPLDWNDPIIHRGFTRNSSGERYDVRLSIHGKQTYLVSCYSQDEAARVYDLALWLIGPKLGRKITPNYGEEFEDITLADIERECPRLINLNKSTPFATVEDEGKDIDDLRRLYLKGAVARSSHHGLSDYNKLIETLKRLRIALESQNLLVQKRKLCVSMLHKLAEAKPLLDAAQLALSSLVNDIQKIESSMERQRPYYQKHFTGDNNSESSIA